jgi:hypothetical protein
MSLLLMRVGFSLAWAAAGIYLAVGARRVFAFQRRWRRVGVVTEGTIIDFEKETGVMTGSRDWIPFFKPVVTFRTREGDARQFTSSTALRPNPYTVGQRVPVRYLSDDPAVADLEESAMAWWPLIALIVASVVALVVATLPFLLAPPG